MNLSSISVKVVATSLLLASTTGLAFAKHHKAAEHHNVVANYKGEANYKAEVPPCPPPKMLMGGFYVGAAVGYDSYRFSNHARIFVPDFATGLADGLATSQNLSVNGWVGSLFLGYGQYFNDLYYLGAEVFGSYSGAQGSHAVTLQDGFDIARFRTQANVNGGWGVSVLPGIKLADTLLAYVRLGYNWASVQGRFNSNFNGIPLVNRNSNDNTVGGFNYGVGMESLIFENWSLRGEFTHTSYSSLGNNRGGRGRFFPAFAPFLGFGGASFSPSDNQFMLGVVYHIA